jgi:hypothetical protein
MLKCVYSDGAQSVHRLNHRVVGAGVRPNSQDGVPQQQEAAPLSLPRLDRLFEASFARDENSASNAGVGAIPSQLKVTKQILFH